MTEPMADHRSARASEPIPGWSVGFITFAAMMMLMVGVFQAVRSSTSRPGAGFTSWSECWWPWLATR